MRLVLLAGLLFAGAAAAQPADYTWSVTPFAGYRFGGDIESDEGPSGDLGDSGSFGVMVNGQVEVNTEWEVYLGRNDNTVSTDSEDFDLSIDYYQLGGTYLGEGEKAVPYLVATVGAARLDPDDSDLDAENFFAFSIGAGLKLFPMQRVGLRLEGRAFGTVIDSDQRFFCRGNGDINCAIQSTGNVMWQWEVSAGAVVRF